MDETAESAAHPAGRPVKELTIEIDLRAKKAKTNPAHVQLKKSSNDAAKWKLKFVNDILGSGEFIQIDFKGGQSPIDPDRPIGLTVIRADQRSGATVGQYRYNIVWVKSTGRVVLEDPVLEIAM